MYMQYDMIMYMYVVIYMGKCMYMGLGHGLGYAMLCTMMKVGIED